MPILIKGGRRLYMNPVAYKLETGEAIKAPQVTKPSGGRLLLHKGQVVTGQEAEQLTAALRKGKEALRKAVEKLTKAARVKTTGDTTPEARKNFRVRAEFKQVLEAILPHIVLVTLGCDGLSLQRLGLHLVPWDSKGQPTTNHGMDALHGGNYGGTVHRAEIFNSARSLSRAYDGDCTADQRLTTLTTTQPGQHTTTVFGAIIIKDTWGRTMRLHELVHRTLENPRYLTEGASA